MAKKMQQWLRDVMADLTGAAPGRCVDPDGRDWMPRVIASTDLASPYFLAMLDRDAGWYLDRVSAGVSGERQ